MDELKILVVDDSPEFNFLMSSLLKFHKISVDSTGDPKEAVSMVNENSYQLVITDYMMDDLNGIELASKIRTDPCPNKSAPIILITAKTLDNDELTHVKNLNLTLIKKPIMPNELYKRVVDIIDAT